MTNNENPFANLNLGTASSSDSNEQIATAAGEEMAAGPSGTEPEGENIFVGHPPTHQETTIFDIETGALPDDELTKLIPEFGEFNKSSVKFGNIKDETKIKAKIEAAREQHKIDAEKARTKFIDRAALDPTTGSVVAIGYLRADGQWRFDDGENVPEIPEGLESVMLKNFWNHYVYCTSKKARLIGFNSNGFDLPFLIRRSWKHRIEVPSSVFSSRYFDRTFVDLMLEWNLGVYGQYITLDNVARFLGVGQKPNDCTGADFAKLLASDNAGDRQKARDYLHNDLTMTWGVAAAMGIVQPLPSTQQPKGSRDDSRKA